MEFEVVPESKDGIELHKRCFVSWHSVNQMRLFTRVWRVV